MTINLEIEKRAGSAEALRKSGKVPAIVYGPKQEPISIAVDQRVFEKVFREAGESTILTLTGLEESIEVLVHDVSFEPTKGGAQHVDFYAIERGKELTTEVALEFVGEAPIVKTGGTVTKVLYEIEVTCRPSDLPSHIDVDISGLANVDDQIKVSDLIIPAGVKVEAEPDEVVAVAAGQREEEPEEVPATLDMDAIEVEHKGKEETSTEEGKAEETEK